VTDTLNDEQQGEGAGEGGQGNESANMKHLRDRAEAATQAEAERDAARRELAIIKSGIDADHPLGKFFVEHYDGDITDTEALVAKAKEMGVPTMGAPAFNGTEQQQQGEGQQEGGEGVQGNEGAGTESQQETGTQQRRALAGGGSVPGEENPDPRKIALDEAQRAIDGGATFDQAAGHMVAKLANAASRGDTRVIVEEVRDGQGRVQQRWQ
jgi:hypothetical protein